MLVALSAAGWYLALGVAALPWARVLRRLGLDPGGAAALSRPVAWTLAGYAGFLVGSAGMRQWWVAGLPILLLPLLLVRRGFPTTLRPLLAAEGVGAAAFAAVALLRLPSHAITGTEKPMDLAILATLLRPGTLPPSDPWLAGADLPYYYFGFVPWVPAARALGLGPDVAYNLLVPLLAGVVAQAAWALARELGAPPRAALLAPWLAVLGGTADGWRQLLAGGAVDLWASSRQIAGAITEFPLFTFQLGDLHPHLLAVPLLLTALALARVAAERPGVAPLLLVSLLYGAAAAANPWYAAPLGAAVALLLLAPAGGLGWRAVAVRLGLAAAVGAGGWAMMAPFWLAFDPPLRGLGVVSTATRWDELALFLGPVLLIPLLVGNELAWRWGGMRREMRQLLRAFWLATIALVAALTGSLALGLAVALGGFFAAQAVRRGARRSRPAWALGLVPLGLLGSMELFYVRDPYGGEFYRMNTVFKASYLAFTLLAALTPSLLAWLAARRRVLARAAAALVLVAGLPQLAVLAGRVRPPGEQGWGGLEWMAGGEADAARWLAARPPGEVLVEGVGDAYSDAARLSAASGVPAVLGWENHERVWRGDGIMDEVGRRRAAVESIYTSGDPAAVGAMARALGATLIAVGSVERRLYGEAGLAAVLAAGEPVYSGAGITLVEIRD